MCSFVTVWQKFYSFFCWHLVLPDLLIAKMPTRSSVLFQISQHWFPDRQRTMATTLIGMSYPLGIVVGQGGAFIPSSFATTWHDFHRQLLLIVIIYLCFPWQWEVWLFQFVFLLLIEFLTGLRARRISFCVDLFDKQVDFCFFLWYVCRK
jgi:hypothetical protein